MLPQAVSHCALWCATTYLCQAHRALLRCRRRQVFPSLFRRPVPTAIHSCRQSSSITSIRTTTPFCYDRLAAQLMISIAILIKTTRLYDPNIVKTFKKYTNTYTHPSIKPTHIHKHLRTFESSNCYDTIFLFPLFISLVIITHVFVCLCVRACGTHIPLLVPLGGKTHTHTHTHTHAFCWCVVPPF